MAAPLKEVVLSGSWLYDASVEQPVFIVRTDFDFWYEMAKEEDSLEEGEAPIVGRDGFAYYVSFRGVALDGSFWPDTSGFTTIAEAKEAAQSKVPSPIRWSDGV